VLSVFHAFVTAVSGAWWSYPLVFGVAMLDAFFPLVPSETVEPKTLPKLSLSEMAPTGLPRRTTVKG